MCRNEINELVIEGSILGFDLSLASYRLTSFLTALLFLALGYKFTASKVIECTMKTQIIFPKRKTKKRKEQSLHIGGDKPSFTRWEPFTYQG